MRQSKRKSVPVALLGMLLLPTCWVSLAGAAGPPLPTADQVKVYDRPSDDGSGIIVEWPKPEQPTEGLVYVIEIATSNEAFKDEVADGAASDDASFQTILVVPSPNRLKSASEIEQYLGYASDGGSTYVSVITPWDHFTLPELTFPERLAELHRRGELTDKELARAYVALAFRDRDSTDPAKADYLTESMRLLLAEMEPQGRLSQKELDWLGRLEAHMSKRFTTFNKPIIAGINAQEYHIRFGIELDGQRSYVQGDAGKAAIFDVQATTDLYKRPKTNNLLFCLLFCAAVVVFLYVAKRNPNLFIRKIAGLDAIEEAIGRATEMGKSVYFVHGLTGMESMGAIAAVTVLGRVASRVASYDTKLRVMNCNPIVTAISQEVVQQAYIEAGRPDAYDPDDVSMVAANQFSYAAAVSAMMVREKPAAVFLMGSFMAESLLLAETGASTGAIQVAGTDSDSQLPFFVTACDYTLIGEELYAASAYLSREPRMLGSLRGQDVGKAFLMLTMILGTIFLTIGVALGWNVEWFTSLFKAF